MLTRTLTHWKFEIVKKESNSSKLFCIFCGNSELRTRIHFVYKNAGHGSAFDEESGPARPQPCLKVSYFSFFVMFPKLQPKLYEHQR
jgi:hypothetical protein